MQGSIRESIPPGALDPGLRIGCSGEAKTMIRLKVNGIERSFDGDPTMPLLWYLRGELALTGTKFGCGVSLCGACTVHLNGKAIRSCVTPMRQLENAEV